MNLPNLLTVLRILLTIVVMRYLFLPGLRAKVIALTVFIIASLTDWLDGYLARRWRATTAFGILLDPIADKVLVLGTLLAFVQMGLMPAWMVLLVVFRELAVTGARMYAAGRHIVIAAAKEGKLKTVVQMLTIVVTLTLLILEEVWGAGADLHFQLWKRRMILGCLAAVVSLTVFSGAMFFWSNRKVFASGLSR